MMPSLNHRRDFLANLGMGFGGLALGSLLAEEGIVKGSDTHVPDGRAHHPARAKSVIWVFLSGGYSHLETFDPKPALNKYAGKTYSQTPFPNPVESPLHAKRFRSVASQEINVRDVYPTIYPMQIGFRHHGQNQIAITDWWPHFSTVVDDICFVRNMWTTDNDHAAENQIHTGRHRLDEVQPSVGAWAHYGLGSINENLPKFVVLGGPTRTDTRASIDSYYLGPSHAGVPIALDKSNPLPFGVRHKNQSADAQNREFTLARRLNQLTLADNPNDALLRARIKSYELAFRMQSSVPKAVDLSQETEETTKLYGLDQPNTKIAGERLLTARRMVERGVRFVQVFPSSYGTWDSHRDLQKNHSRLCATIDKPITGLIKDLKRRGLLEDTIVVFCTEFGRTPGLEERSGGTTGRDHHPNGFTIWMAGAGLKRGYVHGETDELGYHALGEAHYVTDLHATVLHLLGLDNRRLAIPGRKRLDIDFGKPIHDIFS
ncbi:MAG: DUF1501 domain-containing protein [Planctomycetota bacterium]|nr:DUF1501 domain-containing protein [Planctomycetota bacterium]